MGWPVPADCPGCGKRTTNQKLCHECTVSLMGNQQKPRCPVCKLLLSGGICPNCNQGNIAYGKVISAFDYKDLGQQLVHDYKIHRRLLLAGFLAELMATAILQENVVKFPDIIVPVPAHTDAVRERGFSPAAELARLLAKKLKLEYQLDLLWRVRETPKQATLGYQQRQTAQAGAYACDNRLVNGKHIAVVDDVMTTGATLNTIAKILMAAGAASVQCWVLARTLR